MLRPCLSRGVASLRRRPPDDRAQRGPPAGFRNATPFEAARNPSKSCQPWALHSTPVQFRDCSAGEKHPALPALVKQIVVRDCIAVGTLLEPFVVPSTDLAEPIPS